MPGFNRLKDLKEAYENGQFQFSSFRKVPSQATTAGVWVDLSMTSGNPVPNYYAATPLVSKTLDGNDGIYHGQSVAPMKKFVAISTVMTPTAAAAPLTMMLCDYLLYYPFIDMDSTDQQDMVNSVPLPRYSDGDGVRMFLVALAPYTGNGDFSVSYTNQNGVAGRTTGTIRANTAGAIASFVHSASNVANSFGCFLPLQSGDTGVRSVQSITFTSPIGGLAAIVLVKPIDKTYIREITAAREKQYLVDDKEALQINDGAYLNYIVHPNGSLAGSVITGYLDFVYN
jgi:hypothetical protein